MSSMQINGYQNRKEFEIRQKLFKNQLIKYKTLIHDLDAEVEMIGHLPNN